MFVLAVGLLFTTVNTATAQAKGEPFSDDAIASFAKINKQLMPAQMEAQQKMVAILQEENLTPQRFQELAMAQQQQKMDEANPTEAELASMKNANEKLQVIQQEIGGKMQAAIKEAGMEQAEFQRIAIAYQQDENVRAKVDAEMQ